MMDAVHFPGSHSRLWTAASQNHVIMGNVLSWPFRRARAIIYDALILRLTTRWYEVVLSQLDFGSTILDVGIGTAGE